MEFDDKVIQELMEAVAKVRASKPRERVHPRKMSLRRARTWKTVERAHDEIDKVLVLLGKRETISVGKIIELNNQHKMPTMMKHAVVAIYDHLGKRTGENKIQRFIGGHNIAFWSFRRNGYIAGENFGMTGKGVTRNAMHQREGKEGGSKTDRYAKLYNSMFKRKTSYSANDQFVHKTHPHVPDRREVLGVKQIKEQLDRIARMLMEEKSTLIQKINSRLDRKMRRSGENLKTRLRRSRKIKK